MTLQPTLLIEDVDIDLIECLIVEDAGQKSYTFRGPFMELNIQNKNKRTYPSPVVKPQVEKYQDVIRVNRSVGELNHPNTLDIDPKNISHKTTSLKFDGANLVMGEAIVAKTPNGLIVRALMDEQIKLGVSSRGSGTLKDGIVQNDFRYVCNDIVWEPSAPTAFVEAVLESQEEWILENGILVEKELDDLKGKLRNFSQKDINKVTLDIFERALNMAAANMHI